MLLKARLKSELENVVVKPFLAVWVYLAPFLRRVPQLVPGASILNLQAH